MLGPVAQGVFVPKVFPGRHQRVEALLESDDLKSHVTGGEDENADYKQVDEEDGVQGQRLRGFVSERDPPRGLG